MKAPQALPWLVAVASTGCPSEIPSRADAPPAPAAGVDVVKPTTNPRVVEVDGALYSADSPSIAPPAATTEPRSLGTGIPDETNGECRLYAPKFPNPSCCAFETGFDQARARDLCQLDVYLGESVRGSCGYFFASTTESKVSQFRVAPIAAENPRRAAEDHAARLARQTKREVTAESVPGVAGAWFVRYDDLHWAFLPGWRRVRQMSWTGDSCPGGRVFELVAEVTAAREPDPTEAKPMLPTARGAAKPPTAAG